MIWMNTSIIRCQTCKLVISKLVISKSQRSCGCSCNSWRKYRLKLLYAFSSNVMHQETRLWTEEVQSRAHIVILIWFSAKIYLIDKTSTINLKALTELGDILKLTLLFFGENKTLYFMWIICRVTWNVKPYLFFFFFVFIYLFIYLFFWKCKKKINK